MNYEECVQNTIEYIEENLSEELSVEIISANAGYSAFHFCRIFKKYTGESLMSYVRKKRLEKAEIAMKEGATVFEAAQNFGFETQSGFARAYERNYGKKPKK